MKNIIRGIILTVSLVGPSGAFAAVTPISISIFPPVEFPPEDYTVAGVRISALFGYHRYVYGLDAGVIGNITTQGFGGFAVSGLFNLTRGTTNAVIQLAGGANINTNKTNVFGLQAAALINTNMASSTVAGLQLAIFNNSAFTTIYGFQLGIVNKALSVNGFQIGVVNITGNLHGLQLGVINFYDKGLLNMSPVLNIGFD